MSNHLLGGVDKDGVAVGMDLLQLLPYLNRFGEGHVFSEVGLVSNTGRTP